MPIPIKYTTSNVSNSVRLGNIALGVNDTNYGPSTSTGWAGGVSVSTDGYDGEYAIHYLSGTTPRVRKADTFTLTTVAGQIMGTTYANNAAALSALAAAGYTVINTTAPPNTVTSGSVLNLNAGLVMSYPRTNSVWYDISGNGSNGTLINGPTFDSTSNSIVFDGSDDRIETSVTNIVNNASYEVVLNCKGNVSGYNMFIGQYLPYIGVYGGNTIYYSDYINGSQTVVQTNSGTITYNTYYHVVCTREYDGSNTIQKVYINGNLLASGTFSGAKSAFFNPNTISIGDGAAFTWYPFYGNIASANVYNRTLSQSEILQNYYQGNIVTSSLVMALDAGNLVSYPGSGTAWTSLTGSNNGTLTNGPTFSSANGGSIVFDGVDDYVNCGIPMTFTTSFTLNFFFKTSTSGVKLLMGMYNGSGADWWIGTLSNGTLNFSFGSPTKSDIATSTVVTDGIWKMGTCIYDKSINSIFLYLNGSLQNSSNTIPSTVNQPGGNMTIGRFGDLSGFYWPGNMSNVQLYNRALSASEVQQNFNAYRNRFNL